VYLKISRETEYRNNHGFHISINSREPVLSWGKSKLKYTCKHKKVRYYSGGKFDDPRFHTTVQRSSRIIYQSHPIYVTR
jgi:hypothetical protein